MVKQGRELSLFVEQTFADDTAGHWCLALVLGTSLSGPLEEGTGWWKGWGFNTISQDEQWWSNNFAK